MGTELPMSRSPERVGRGPPFAHQSGGPARGSEMSQGWTGGGQTDPVH